jgi:hypothetical protein
MRDRLIQFQCEREGTLFYYQTSLMRVPWQMRCPVCGSKRVEQTGREYEAIDERHGRVDLCVADCLARRSASPTPA